MNPLDTTVWEEALAKVPGAGLGEAVAIQPLAGGTTNATFRVQTREGAFVVRLHEPYSVDLGVDRRREAVLHAAAAGAGLASRILAADPQGRYLVTEFLAGDPWRTFDLDEQTRRDALAQTLLELHAVQAPEVGALDVRGLLERHAAQLALQDTEVARELAPQLARARDVLARQAEAARPACIVHGDLNVTNMIGAARPRLIDWEYAAVADPLTDLACLAAYYPQVLVHGERLLRRCGLPASASLPVLEELAWVYRLLSNLWYRRLELARRHPPPAH